jgi:TRAP-type C4-dicarboxylate transport system permease small subunit
MTELAADADASERPRTAVGRLLTALAQLFAFAGGAVLTAITLMSVASIVGRWLLNKPVAGDFELVQLGSAVCVAAFLPYCQLRRGNIIVDFFTARTSERTQGVLDAFGALLLAIVMGLVAWRTGAGAVSVKSGGETSMIMGLPVWIAYALMAPCFGLTALIALHGAWTSLTGRAP